MTPRFSPSSLPFTLLIAFSAIACSTSSGAPDGARATPSAAAGAITVTTAVANSTATGTVAPVGAATPLAPGALTPQTGGAVVDLGTAQRLEAEGDLANALNAYLSLTLPGTANRGSGILGETRVLLALDRAADARKVLEPFLIQAAEADTGPAHFLLGRAYAALKLPDQALAQFDAYVQSGRPASAYAQYDRALAFLDLGQPATAALAAQNGLSATLPGAARRSFILLVAQSYERANQPADALRWYQNLLDASPGDEALALSRIVALKRGLGDASAAVDFQRLLGNYPSSPQALAGLKDASGRGETIDSYLKGLVYYRHNDYSNAQGPLGDVIAASPNAPSSAEAYYFLAAISESQDKNDQAMGYYARAQMLNPASSIADDALWWRGRLQEDARRLDEAATTYGQLVATYPSSSWTPDAAFRLGMLAYDRRDYLAAAQMWANRQSIVSDLSEKTHLTLWRGKALLKAGDKAGAQALLGPLLLNADDDYEGIRAAGLLKGQNGPPKATRETKIDLAPSLDWAAAEGWLSQKTGRALSPPAGQAWYMDPRWKRAQELWLVGRGPQADTEVFDLIAGYGSDPMAMYTLSRQLGAESRISMSARAGQRLLRVLDTNPDQGLPRALTSLSYPAPYAAGLQRAANAQKISPLLMLAFIRQESFFDPGAESGAGAIGLTQLLPVTAKTFAPRVDITNFDPDQLSQADLNLRIGAAYMAQQLKDFDDSIFAAFSAYNAGPAATTSWYRAAKGDGDEFLEQVAFSETRLYVRNVSENYAIYRYLYGGEDEPSLPSD